MDKNFHLLDYWAILHRGRWVVYLAVCATTMAALVGSYLVTPIYSATVTLQIERQTPDIFSFGDMGNLDYSWVAYTDFYQTQYRILASDAVNRLAVRRLNLTSHPLFEDRKEKPSLWARLRSLIPSGGAKSSMTPEDIATAWIQGGLQVAPVRNSHLVNVSWSSPDPALAAEVANAVADAFVQFNIESKYSTTDQAAEFLVDQIATLKEQIAAIEERLQAYGESKRIVSIDETHNITLKALSDIARRRTEAQTRLAEKEAAYRAVRDAPVDALPEVLHSELIARLKAEQADHEVEYSEKAQLFKEDWPEMRTLRSRLEQSRYRLDEETREIARKVLAAAEADYQKALAEVRNLDSLMREQESAAQKLKRDAFEYANLQAEVQKKRETLNALITRQNEMELSTRLKDLEETSTNVRIVDRARTPQSPVRPKKRLNVTLGFLLGLGLGVGMAFFLDYLDNTVKSPSDVERVVQLPVLAVIPRHAVSSTPLARVRRRTRAEPFTPVDLVVHQNARTDVAESYRGLRTSILLSNPGRPPRQLVVTSALPEEGKSATAVNLAVALAQLGRRVLVVDSDLRRPRLHKVFESDNGRGVSTYLSGLEEDPCRLVVDTGLPNLDLLPSGPIPPNPSELLNSSVFTELGRRLLDAGYDHVVYDSPPGLSVSDPLLIASVVDGTLVVVRAHRTPRESLRLVVEKFGQSGLRPAGVVLNDVALEPQGYRHGYYGRYYRGEDAPDEGAEQKSPGEDQAGATG